MERDRPDSAGSSRFLALVYAKRSFFGKCRSRLRETDILLAPIRPAALSPTRNNHFSENVALVYAKRAFCWHPFVPRRSRLRETIIFNETVALASELGRAAPRSLRCALSCVLLRPGRSESVSSLRPTLSDERWASCRNAPLALMSCELHYGAARLLR